MRAILIKRREFREDSLMITTLSDDGMVREWVLPGILKSRKRNAFYMIPGTIWDLLLSGDAKRTKYAKPGELIHAPLDAAVSYEEMEALAALMEPLKWLITESKTEGLYPVLSGILYQWQEWNLSQQDYIAVGFTAYFLELMGLLNRTGECGSCDQPIGARSHLTLQSGFVCHDCYQKHTEWRKNSIEANILTVYLKGFTNLTPPLDSDRAQSEAIRKQLLTFLSAKLA